MSVFNTPLQIFLKKSFLFSFCLFLSLSQAFAQTATVTGTVKDSRTGKAIDNVNVLVKGTKTGTVTDSKGNYSINAATDATLVFSGVGFSTQEARINSRSSINITMAGQDQQLESVVVTALGIKREERALGYATTTVQGEDLTKSLSSNWTDALSGKVAGLNLVRSNSGPGGSNKIILRGESNLTSGEDNAALIVVDGVVINKGSGRASAIGGESAYGTGSDNQPADYGTSLNDINPEDIESVNVLKGPGAAALYGQRGANGAIIITTKSGATRKKGLGITFVSNASIETVNRWPDLQYEYGQGVDGSPYYSYGASADGNNTGSTSSAYGPRFNGQMFYQVDPVTQAQGLERTPWVPYKNSNRDFFKTGKTLTNTITLAGGNNTTSARFSFTNVNNTWIIPNTGYDRNTVALSVSSKVTDKLQVVAKVNYTNKSSDNLPGAGYGNQSLMYWYIFWMPNANSDILKNYWVNGQTNRRIFYPFSTFPENPYAVSYEFINRMNRNSVTGNVQASYKILENLNLQVRATTDMSYEKRAQERPYDAGSRYRLGSFRTQNINSQETGGDFLLKYDVKSIKNIELSITGGGSTLTNTYTRDENRADSLTTPDLYSFANAAGPLITIPNRSQYRLNSFYALMSAAYKNYLYLDLTGRTDWNSVLATPTRTTNAGFFYPSASVSFILSQVVKLPSQINFAKLRFSAAKVGSGLTNPYRTAYNYATAGSIYNGGLQNPSLLANPNLLPLKTVSYEAGANVKMFRNRLTVDVATYIGNTKDQILNRILDRAAGSSEQVINAGRVSNTGFELAVSGTPIRVKNGFSWTTSLVYSTNRNKVEELPDSSLVLRRGPVGGGQIVAKVGGSMGDLYGQGYQRAPDGQIMYDPVTGVALITTDVVYLGNTNAKGRVGFSNQFEYKGFSLNLLFDAQYGAVAHSLTHYKLAEQGKLTKTLPGRYNGIIGNGVVYDAVTGKYNQNTVIATDIDEYYRSHFGINNAEGSTFSTDFIKFREARLDYTLGAKVAKRIGVQRVTFGVYGRDLFIWSKWPGFDPEFGTLSGTDITTGFEVGQFPSTRTMGANLVLVL